MAEYYAFNLYMSKIAAQNMLAGLAGQYRNMPNKDIEIELRSAIEDILRTIERSGVDIFKKRSPFYTYTQLISYKSLNESAVS